MLHIQPIEAFSDNYIWLIADPDSDSAFVVDPGDAAPVIARLEELGLTLTGVLITHHHFDHVGGLAVLRERELVETRRAGQTIYYRLADPAVRDVIETLMKIYCPEMLE